MKRDKELIKSTGIIGISQALVMFFSLLKNKVFSVLLGVDGIGLFGLFQSVLDMVRSFTSLGIHTSGIRYIAAEEASENPDSQPEMIYIFRKLMMLTGIIGALACFIFAGPISSYAFGGYQYLTDIRILSFSIFFTAMSASQNSIFQALKKITVFAKSNITASAITFLVGIFIAYRWGMRSIPVIYLASSIIIWLTGYFFTLELNIPERRAAIKDILRKGRPVLIMGLLTVMTGIATSGAVLFLKMVITQKGGLESAGYFQAAWIIANSYLGIAITALGTDLYPRLSAVNADRTGFMHIMNNYMRNGLVLITPLLILLIIFAPLAVNILYSSAFAECASLLRWLMLAFFFRSLSMMMSYGLLARARKKAYLIIETMWYLPFLSISYLGFDRWGIDAVGIASLISYIIYFVLLSAELITSGYRIDHSVINSGMIYSITLISVFLIQYFHNNIYGTIIASLVMLPAMYFSLRDINRMYPLGETVNTLINKLRRK